MSELNWVMLEDVSGRVEAEGIKSLLEAEGIRVELFQEAIGTLFPVAVDGLGTTQIFVPKRKLSQARTWLKAYREGIPREKPLQKRRIEIPNQNRCDDAHRFSFAWKDYFLRLRSNL